MTFPRAIDDLAADQPTTSHHWNTNAEALNARLRSGLADCTWRVHSAAYFLGRQFTSEIGNTQDRRWDAWLSFYMHLDPRVAADRWNAITHDPVETNPIVAAVMGIEGILDGEEDRLAGITPAAPSATPAELWEAAKLQRGVVAYDFSDRNDPFCSAAIHWQQAAYASSTDPVFGESGDALHGQVTGGYMPGPEIIPCGPGTALRYHFKSLKPGVSDRIYSTCSTAGDYATSISRRADRYVIVAGGITLELPFRDWVCLPQGPATLALPVGRQLYYIAAEYVSGFRGNASQRASTRLLARQKSPAWQRFFTRQLRLAPAGGVVNEGVLTPVYPTLSSDVGGGYTNAGDYLMTEAEAPTITAHTAFTFVGFAITATDLTGPVTARLQRADHSLVKSLTITNGTTIHWLTAGESALEVLLVTSIAAGAISIEFAELEVRLPDLDDALTWLRLTTTLGDASVMDGAGIDRDDSARLLDKYWDYGAVVADEQVPTITLDNLQGHPWHEAARELLRPRLRVIPRRDQDETELLDSYNAAAKTLRLRRFAAVGTAVVDLWEGIAPDVDPVTVLTEGLDYVVHGTTGSVTYDGVTYTVGQYFTAGSASAFEVEGDAHLRTREGIYDARPNGRSNKWLMHLGHCRSSSDAGAPELEDDTYYPLTHSHSDALFYGTVTDEMRAWLDARARSGDQTTFQPMIIAECPPGMVYADAANASASAAWCSAHQVYPKPYRITSCVMDGDDHVVITLDRELRAIGGSPEPRCDANVPTDYLAKVGSATPIPVRDGDAAYGADGLPDDTEGSANWRMFLTREIPLVYEDANDTRNATDTRKLGEDMRWCWFVIEAICGGFADRALWTASPCAGIRHYSFEALMYQAGSSPVGENHRHRWPELLVESVRPDKAWSTGPLPNTLTYADHHNLFGRALNLLTHVPLYGPIPFESRRWVTNEREDDAYIDFKQDGAMYDPYHLCDPEEGPFLLSTGQGLIDIGEGWWYGEESLVQRNWQDTPGAEITAPEDSGWHAGLGYWGTKLEWMGLASSGGYSGLLPPFEHSCNLYDDPDDVTTGVVFWRRTSGQLRFADSAAWLSALPAHVQELMPQCQFGAQVNVRKVVYDDEGNKSDTTTSECWLFSMSEAVDGVLTLASDTLGVDSYFEQDTWNDVNSARNNLPFVAVDLVSLTPGIVLVVGLVTE